MTKKTPSFRATQLGENPNPFFYPQLVKPGDVPVNFNPITPAPLPLEKNKPTITETVNSTFSLYNAPYRGIKSIVDRLNVEGYTTRDKGYAPIEEGILNDVPEEYWANVLAEPTRELANLVKKNIKIELEDKEIAARSGKIVGTISSLGAAVLDPINLIPFSQTIKYANVSKGLFVNMLNVSKTVVPAIAMQNAILVGTKETEDLTDWAHQTMFESFIALSIGGALSAYASRGVKGELKNAQAVFETLKEDGINIKYRVGEKGEVAGTPIATFDGPPGSVGAMRAKHVQELLDSGVVNFKDNVFIKKAFGWASPVIRGVTNPSPTVQKLTHALFPNVFETAKGIPELIRDPSAYAFVKNWQGVHAQLGIFAKYKWLESLGIEGVGKNMRAKVGALQGKYQSFEEFMEEAGFAFRRKESANKYALEVADAYSKELYKPLWEELKKRYPDMQEEMFTSIVQHLNRAYHKGKIQEAPDRFIKDAIEYLNEVNEKVAAYRQPIIDNATAIKSTKDAISSLQNKLVRPQDKSLLAAQERLIEVENLINESHAKANRLFSSESIEKQNYIKAATEKLEAEKSALQDKIKSRSLSDAERDLIKKEITTLSEDLEQLEARKAQLDAQEKLDIQNSKVPGNVITPDMLVEGATLKDLPKLRNVLNKQEIEDVADSILNNITQLNEEQILGRMFGGAVHGFNDFLKNRVLLWNDAYCEPWLVNNLETLSGLYMDQLSKRIYLDDVFRKWGNTFEEGEKGIVEALKSELNIAKSKVLENPESAERTKQLKALDKQFKDNEKFIKDMVKIYMGNYVDNTTTAYRISDGVKKFAVATLLGNLPILQLTEFFTPFFRFTFDEYISQGLTDTLKRMQYVASKKISGAEQGYVRGAFADLSQGINVANGNRTQALVGYGTQYQPKTLLERYVNNLANATQNVNLANHIMDFQETIVSFASQSTLLRILKKYVDGETLSKFEVERLDRGRLNPKEWGQRILDQYGVHKTEDGAWVSNFHLWTDQEAARRFKIAIEQSVREVIIKPGPLDVPFAFRDPVTSMFMQFSSYMFAATNNFTIPALTSPDAQKAVGMILMMASGAAVDPLRQLAKGEEIDYSLGALVNGALLNSGLFAWQYPELIKANQILDIPLIRPLQSDRFKRKSSGYLNVGPIGGITDMSLNAISAGINGEMNKRDLKNIGKLTIPFFGSWFMHRPIDAALGSLDYPATRSQAKAAKEYSD